MRLVANTGTDRVVDVIEPWLRPDHQMDLASDSFSLFAFGELMEKLLRMASVRVLLPPGEAELGLFGAEADRAARNRLQSLFDSIDHIKADRSEDDILYELLLKLGLGLCVPIETRVITGRSVHSVGAGTLIACLDDKIDGEAIEPLAHGIAAWHAELAPAGETTVVFRDSAFPDDVAKTNCTAILQQHGLGNVRSL